MVAIPTSPASSSRERRARTAAGTATRIPTVTAANVMTRCSPRASRRMSERELTYSGQSQALRVRQDSATVSG